MSGALRGVVCAVLLCTVVVGCGDEKKPVDTTSTEYLYDEVFNPCREIPAEFLSEHHLHAEPEPLDNLIDGHIYFGCVYRGQDYDFAVLVSNKPLSQVARLEPHTVQPVQIAGRAAKMQALPLERRFCDLDVEMTGGTLAFELTPKIAIEACPTLSTVAADFISVLPPGV